MVGTVNINKATSHKIHTELGISKTKSQAIIKVCKQVGGKLTIDDLRKVFKANPDFVEFLLEVSAIEFGSPWVARKSDANASSTHLASDANRVPPHTHGVSQQATGLSQPATSVDTDQAALTVLDGIHGFGLPGVPWVSPMATGVTINH